MPRLRRLAGSLAISVLALAIAVVAAEFLIRRFVSVPITPQLFVLDEHTNYRNRPHADEWDRWRGIYEYHWTTNSRGYRGRREYTTPKPAGMRRVLAIGDSFTFGTGVHDAEAWPAVAEAMLDRTCPQTPIEIVNAGTSAFSTSQQLVLLEREGLALEPDIVVYGFFVNDVRENVDQGVHELAGDSLVPRPPSERPRVYEWKEKLNRIPGYSWAIANSALVNAARRAYFAMRQGDMRSEAAPSASSAADSARVDSLRWRTMEAIVGRMRDRTEEAGAKFLVLLMPDSLTLQMESAGVPEPEQRRRNEIYAGAYAGMRGVCSRLSLDCVDFAAWQLGRNDGTLPSLYIRNEGHFAAPGHRHAAMAVAPRLAELLGCGAATPMASRDSTNGAMSALER